MPVLGIGGIFVKSADPDAAKRWYQEVLGLELNSYGGFDFAHSRSAETFADGARTIFARFEDGSDYFAPSEQHFMVNFIVEDLDALLARIKAAGVEMIGEPESFDYGRFAWLMDPDGVKIELWEPPAPAS